MLSQIRQSLNINIKKTEVLYQLNSTKSAFDHEDNMNRQNDKQGNTRTDRAAIYGRSSDQKESPVDWTPHEDVTRQATKTGSLLSNVFLSQKERAPSRMPSRET